MTDNPFLVAALEYAVRGWAVFPIRPGRKTPLTKNGFKNATTDPEQIRAWWTQAPAANVGIATGAVSGLVVIDVDQHSADGEASLATLSILPATYEVATPNAGRHIYYACTGPIKSRVAVLPGIDLKADGGYVVAPPSSLRSCAKPYGARNTAAVASFPEGVLPIGSPAPKAATRRVGVSTTRYAGAALKYELAGLRSAAEGERNNQLNRAAFALGQLVAGGHLDRGSVESELTATAALIGLGEREAAGTIRSGIEAGMKEPRVVETHEERPQRQTTTPATSSIEPILIPGPHRDDMENYTEQSNKDFSDAVLAALPDDLIYRKGGLPGELLGSAGRRTWNEFSPDRMRLLVDEHMKLGAWYPRKNTDGAVLVYKPCNRDCAGLVIASAYNNASIRALDLLISYPVYRPGFVRASAGWNGDAGSGIYYDEPDALKGLEPERDIEKIHEELHELVIDFPFADEASRQNFIGLMLTPIVAPAIDGNRPLHLLLSPLERTGKTKLAEEVLGGVVLGRETPALQITDRDEERDKRLLALLLQGETIVHLDNLPPSISSSALASILTATTYQGRILGASRIVNLPNSLTVVGSGNNTECNAEIAKRTIPIMLQPRTAHPETRTIFLHPDLRAHVKRSRRRILAVLLGMVENWIAGGREPHANRFGGFESWSETVGGILHANALNRWRMNEEEWRRSADPMSQQWETFAAAWWRDHGESPVRVHELLALAEAEECFGDVLSRRSDRARQTAFGALLRRRTNTPMEQHVIRRTAWTKYSEYRLERRK